MDSPSAPIPACLSPPDCRPSQCPIPNSAKASLEDAGIDYVELGARRWLTSILGGSLASSTPERCRIQVPRDCEAEARVLLDPLQFPDPDAEKSEGS